MAGDQNLGEWGARPVDSVPTAGWPSEGSSARPPSPPSAGGDDRRSDRPHRNGRGPAFWLGVVVGLVPLVALLAGLIGYRLASDDDPSGEIQGAVVAGADTSDGTGAAEDLPVETTPLPTSTSSSTSVVPVGPLVATGMVTDGTVELAGVLPADSRSRWTAEMGDLAEALGLRLVDRTEEAPAGGPGEATPPAELVVGFPGAVVFAEQSPQSFDGNPTAVFEAVAGVLNRGTARLNIVGYADPSDPEAALLALSRTEHVHEHLVEFGVDPARLSVEARSSDEAPAGASGEPPVDRRADLEFLFAS